MPFLYSHDMMSAAWKDFEDPSSPPARRSMAKQILLNVMRDMASQLESATTTTTTTNNDIHAPTAVAPGSEPVATNEERVIAPFAALTRTVRYRNRHSNSILE